MTYELIIIGAGVWGCSAALKAKEMGVSSVLLIEARNGVAQESSAKAGGIVTDLVWHEEDIAWVQQSRHQYEKASVMSGDASILQRYGMLTLAHPDRTGLLQQRALGLKERGIAASLWDHRHIATAYPELDRVSHQVTALWTPGDFHVNPTAYCEAVFRQSRDLGLQAALGTRVSRIARDGTHLRLWMGQDVLNARRILITAGTWTRKLTRTAGIDIPLRPYRAQLASLDFPHGYHLPMVWELSTDVYLVPDGPHNLLAGDGTRLSEHDPDNYQTSGDDPFISSIAGHVLDLTSRAEQAGLRTAWAGLCGGTPDRRPLVGPVADGLFVAAGDQGFGIMRGPAIASLAAQIAMGEADAPHLDPLRTSAHDFDIRPGFTLETEI